MEGDRYDKECCVPCSFNFLSEEWNEVIYLRSDDGCKLFIDKIMIIDNDGLHSDRNEMNGYIGLKTGKHPVEIIYFERGQEQSLKIIH